MPRIFRRRGRAGFYVNLSRRERNVSLGTDDEAEAYKRLAERIETRRVQALAPGEKKLSEFFKEAVEIADHRNTPKTAYEVGLNLARVESFLDREGISSARAVDRALVERYVAYRRETVPGPGPWMKRGVSASRVNREMDSWKRAMKLAVEQGSVSEQVLKSFVKLREPRPKPHDRGLTKQEIALFFEKLDRRYRPLCRLVLGTAMRDEEVRHFEASDIEDGRAITVTPKPGWSTKGYRYRTIPVTPETIRVAREFLLMKAGLNLDKKKVWEKIRAACDAAGIPRFSLHDLRRAWASHMLLAGHSVQNISRWLGHADLMTTMRYLRVVDRELPDAATLPF